MYTLHMIKTNIKTMILNFILCMAVCCLVGCESKQPEIEEETISTETVEETPLYLIVRNDTAEEEMVVYSYITGLEHDYKYSYTTQFMDKYGNYESSSKFVPGKVIEIGGRDSDGYLATVQISDDVWEYEDVSRFSIDAEKGIFTIADTKYSIQDKFYVFSNGERTVLDLISQEDTLSVIGKDKKILSIVVTTGHGILHLSNTEVFEGSHLQLDNDMFIMITDNMYIELPEGTYTLKVANDGWGGTQEIEILREEMTEINLEELKGEGRKKGLVSFEIDIDNVEVRVDYKIIDHTSPVELTYGTHVLEIKAEGYQTWKKYLSVNSPDATLVIEMEEDEDYTPPEEPEGNDGEENEEIDSESTEMQ